MEQNTDGTITISLQQLAVGVAHEPCPYCTGPLTLRLPKLSRVQVSDLQSPSLRLGLNTLTPTERHLFDAVHRFLPDAVATGVVMHELDDASASLIRQNLYRMRPKLARSGWVIISKHSSLRLIEPVVPDSDPPTDS